MAAPKNDAQTDELWLIVPDGDSMRSEKKIFRLKIKVLDEILTSLMAIHRFVIFENFKNSCIM